MCLIIILSIFPFIYMFIMSFKSTTNAADISISISKLSLLQYRKIFALENFGKYIFNSVFVAVAGVVLTVIVCSLAGYAFAKLNFKGNDKIFFDNGINFNGSIRSDSGTFVFNCKAYEYVKYILGIDSAITNSVWCVYYEAGDSGSAKRFDGCSEN